MAGIGFGAGSGFTSASTEIFESGKATPLSPEEAARLGAQNIPLMVLTPAPDSRPHIRYDVESDTLTVLSRDCQTEDHDLPHNKYVTELRDAGGKTVGYRIGCALSFLSGQFQLKKDQDYAGDI